MRLIHWRGALAALLAVALLSCGEAPTAPSSSSTAAFHPRVVNVDAGVAKVVISQVYGAGNNTGAVLQNDYVELFNAGTASQSLAGWSVQYASATGTGAFAAFALTGSIAPGQYFLVKLAGGTTNGAALPTPDATGTLNLSGTAGKVVLADQSTTIGCNGGSIPCSSAQLAHIVDLVGFGTGSGGANFYEGTGAAPTISTTTAAFRANHGCTDTNNNAADFATGAPAPRNSTTTLAPCTVVPPTVGPLDHVVVSGGGTLTFGSTSALTAALQDAANLVITDPLATYSFSSADPLVVQVLSSAGNSATLKGVAPGGPIDVTVSATSNGVTKSATVAVTVVGGAVLVPSTTFVSEVHYDNPGTDVGEAVEIEGDAGTTLDGWSLVLYNGTPGSSSLGVYGTVSLSGTIPATCGARGVLVFPLPVNGIQNGEADGWALINAQGQVTELTSYEGTFTASSGPAAGLTSTATQASEAVAPSTGKSIQRAGNGVWFGPRASTFGACNPALPLGAQGSVTVTSGKTELALGMQTQFFYGGTDSTGAPVTSVVWSTSNTGIITVDAKGIVTAKSLGTAQLIATAPDGATGTVDMTVYLAAGASGIRLGHNTEFGEPQDADASDDFLIRRPQYTVSYNPRRGGANWVSWNLDASHIGANGRCPGTCYSADTALSNAGLPAYTTADWVSGSVYDRGHMAPSADWTSSEADNNTTFFLTNFLPQLPDLNQGPWERLESALRDSVSAANGSREAYIIAGGVFANGVGLGSILNLGKIWIPNATWKVAVITPAGTGINANGTLPPNTTVLAVNMPNVAGIGGADWRTYLTTVASIEQATGYDLLALLADDVECRVEGRNCTPTARVTSSISGGGWQALEGQTVTFSSATSTDPDPTDVLARAWSVNGVSVGSASEFSYTFATDGVYEVRLTVTDPAGASSVATVQVMVQNVAPVLSAISGATILRGESYTASGSFTDPGLDTWTASVNYGDGSGSAALALSGMRFELAHTFNSTGTFTVAVAIGDGVATGTATATVLVRTAEQGLAELESAVAALPLNKGQINSLLVKLATAKKQLAAGNATPAMNVLQAFAEELRATMQSGRLSVEVGQPIIDYTQRLVTSIALP
jgi:DNA/RNA endonuclease G (NUC1)